MKALLEKFYPELTNAKENVFANKIFPDSYYSFKHRRIWAKLRRIGFFVKESENALRSLLYDEFHFYTDLYDFSQFETENPIIETIQEETIAANNTDAPLIVELKEEIIAGNDTNAPLIVDIKEEKKIEVDLTGDDTVKADKIEELLI